MEVGGLVALGLAVREDRIKHDPEHPDEDHRAEDQHHRMEMVKLLGDRGHGRLEVDLIYSGATRRATDPPGRTSPSEPARRQRPHEGAPDCFHRFLTQIFHLAPFSVPSLSPSW